MEKPYTFSGAIFGEGESLVLLPGGKLKIWNPKTKQWRLADNPSNHIDPEEKNQRNDF